jgi:mannosyltransferase OCH1-like enzyme
MAEALGAGRHLTQYWHSEDPPPYIAELISSYSFHNPEMVHRVFSKNAARDFVAAHFTEREVAAFDACAVPAMQADYFRYCAMLQLGGICSDADMRCARALQPLVDMAAAGLLISRPDEGIVINGFFAFRSPEHPLVRLALEIATLNIERRTTNSVWFTTGPGIFTLLTLLHDAGSIDAFRSAHEDRCDTFTLHVQNVCDVFEDRDTPASLFDDVTTLPYNVLRRYAHSVKDLPYKHHPGHWTQWQRIASIYSPST